MYAYIDIYDDGIFLKTRIEEYDNSWYEELGAGIWRFMMNAGEWRIYKYAANPNIMCKIRDATEHEVTQWHLSQEPK